MIEVYCLSNVVEQELRTWAVVFDMTGRLKIHHTSGLPTLKQFSWDNHDVRDEGVNGPMNCYSRWVDTMRRRCQTTHWRNLFPNG